MGKKTIQKGITQISPSSQVQLNLTRVETHDWKCYREQREFYLKQL